jgi:hypothetical protein
VNSPHAQQVVDLFQPVTSSWPPAATLTDQPLTPPPGDESPAALAPQSRFTPKARRWTGRGAGLVAEAPGAVIAVAVSVALVLMMAGITLSTTSSSSKSPDTGITLGRLPAPTPPAPSNEQPGTVTPPDAPAGDAGQMQMPATAYPPDPPVAPEHQRPVPSSHRVPPAAAIPPVADHGPVLPAAASPRPSTGTAADAENRTVPTGPRIDNTHSPETGTQPCDCDDGMRKIRSHGDQPAWMGRSHEPGAQRSEYRSLRAAEERVREQEKREKQDAQAGSQPRPNPGP